MGGGQYIATESVVACRAVRSPRVGSCLARFAECRGKPRVWAPGGLAPGVVKSSRSSPLSIQNRKAEKSIQPSLVDAARLGRSRCSPVLMNGGFGVGMGEYYQESHAAGFFLAFVFGGRVAESACARADDPLSVHTRDMWRERAKVRFCQGSILPRFDFFFFFAFASRELFVSPAPGHGIVNKRFA